MKRILPYIMLMSALSLAATAAYYSIFGLSKLFSSQANAVIFMASILEASKLVTASYLHRHWKSIKWLSKLYLTIAMIILMAITSLGIYGFLVSSFQDTAYKMSAVDQEVSVLQLKQQRYETNIGAIRVEKETLNTNISELTRGLSNNVISYIDGAGNRITTTSSATRNALQRQLETQLDRLDRLNEMELVNADSISSIELQILDIQINNDAAAELGPLMYVAAISNTSLERVVNWFILLFIIVFDPLAVILLVSANHLLNNKEPDAPMSDKVDNLVSDISDPDINETPVQASEVLAVDSQPKSKFTPPSLHNAWRIGKQHKK